MFGRIVLVAPVVLAPFMLACGPARRRTFRHRDSALEKTMERRTSCLQSNVDFLQTTIVKLSIDHQQKLGRANADRRPQARSPLAEDRRRSPAGGEEDGEDQKKKTEPPAKDAPKMG